MKHKYNNQVERLWKLDTVSDSSEHGQLVNQTRKGLNTSVADDEADSDANRDNDGGDNDNE